MEKTLIDPDKLVTQAEYARRQGLSTTRVGQLIMAGKLPAIQISGGLILCDPPEEYVKGTPGRPRLEKK